MPQAITRRGLLMGSASILGLAAVGGFGLTTLTGCTTQPAVSKALSNYRYQFLGNQNMSDAPKVAAAVSAYLKKHGQETGLKFDPNQNYDQAMTLAISAGNAGDMYFTAPWINTYSRNASQGDLLALDDLLPKYAPKLWKSLTPQTWDTARVNGKIYGVINQQRFPKLFGYYTQQKLAEKYNLDVNSINSFAELEPYLAKIKQNQPNLTPWYTDNTGSGGLFYPEVFGWDPVALAYGLVVRHNDPELKVFNMYDTDEYRAAAKTIYQWKQAGLIAEMPPAGDNATAQLVAGQIAANVGQIAPDSTSPGSFPIVGKSLVKTPLLNTDGVLATLTGINASAKDPEKLVQYLELVNTDKDLFNLVCFGIKGEHWEFKDESIGWVGFPQGVTAANSKWNPNEDWMFGNQFNAYYRTEEAAKQKVWKEDAQINRDATPSLANGYNFDTTSVQTQVATLTAAIGEYQPQAAIAQTPYPQNVSALLKAMDGAGLEKVQSAAQSQMDAFRKSKKTS